MALVVITMPWQCWVGRSREADLRARLGGGRLGSGDGNRAEVKEPELLRCPSLGPGDIVGVASLETGALCGFFCFQLRCFLVLAHFVVSFTRAVKAQVSYSEGTQGRS